MDNSKIGLKLVIDLLREVVVLGRDVVKKMSSGAGGLISSWLMEIQDIVPDIERVDAITFTASLTAVGGVAVQAAQVRVNPDYDFVLFGISGFLEDPNQDPEDACRVTFQCREAGRNSDLFTTPLNMGALIGNSGPAAPIEWRPQGTYLFRHGAEIQPTFAVTAALTNAGPRTIGVVLYGAQVRKKGN